MERCAKKIFCAVLAIIMAAFALPAGVIYGSAAGSRAGSTQLNTAENAGALLVPVPGSGCIVDDGAGFVYGLAQGITSLDGFAGVPSGYDLEYLPTGNGFGTGTVVNIIKNDMVEGRYSIVIFGDVNGDGSIDSIDAGTIVDYENYIKSWDPVDDAAYLKASDINGDNSRDSLDAGLVVDFENYVTGINQTTGLSYSCIITFDSNGGSPVAPLTGNLGEAVVPPANPVKTGYTFTGWVPALPASFSGGSTAVTAQWTVNYYTITFNANGGSGGAAPSLAYGTVPEPPAVTRTGYTLTGWLPAVEAVTQTAVYTAQWTANTYTVTYHANGGTGTTANSAHTYNIAANLTPNGFVKTGSSFLGWSANPNATAAEYTNGQSVINLTPTQNGVFSLFAVWKLNKYFITFDSMGGTPVSTIGQNYGTPVTPPAPPTKTGYTFAGWLPPVPSTMPAGGAACVAQWTINQYTINFDSAGGSAVPSITQNYGTAVTPPAAPVKTGYTFTGWLPAVPATMPASATTCVAQWSIQGYAITFNANGGTGGEVQTVPYGVTPVAPVVSKPGYTFAGWSPQIAAATGDAVYTAQWTVNQYTISFDAAGGSSVGSITQDFGTPVTAPAAPSRMGYTFTGWQPAVPAAMPAEDTLCVAQWTVNQYTITFDSAGGSPVAAITQDYGTAVTAPAPPVKTGYTFTGWQPAVPATMPAVGTTCVAQWTINRYTITFDSAGGSAVTAITQDYGSAVTAPAPPAKTGFTFSGWQPAVPAAMPVEDTLCVAQWTVNQYTITFDSAGGSPVAAITQDYGTAVTAPAPPVKAGYTFAGWQPAVPAAIPASATTCVAQWTINQYSITFDSAGGSAVTAITQNYLTAVTPPAAPVKTGYTFAGWQPAVPATMPASATTCVAQWTINQYTITFDSAGGSPVAAITQDYGTAVTVPTPPVKTGYTFTGWQPAVPATMPASATTCVAQWTINQYTITFNSAGGSAVAAITQDYGTAVTVPPPPAKTGYTFTGWQPAVPATMPASATTCVAQWIINQYTITFNSAGGSAVAAITQDFGTAITAPAPPIKTGYTFTGWQPAVPATMPAVGTTCVAQWTVNQYTITFDSAGGSPVASITQDYGTAVTAPAHPVKAGYTFAGWLPAVPGAMPAEDMTCVAQWEINRYTIIFNANGGSGGTSSSVVHGTMPTPPSVTKTGYTFTGWDQPVSAATADKTYYAQWAINRYTITFSTEGGSEVPSVTQDYATTVTPPDDPEREGYMFTGWQPAVPATMPAGGETCVAQWLILQSTITFDSAGGSAVPSITQDYGTVVEPPDDPERTGYTFTGWQPAVPATMPATEVNCVAQWTINYYQITFDANGGTGGQTPLVAYGVVPTPPSVKKLGYALESWSPEIVPATESVTYTAQWIPYTYVPGDIIDYGSYPQTKVTDSGLITALEAETLSPDNTVIYGGEKYKRVYFSQYTALTGGTSTDPNDTRQDDNGYYLDTVYWFKFELIEWRVLSNTDGELLVMAEQILNSKEYYDQPSSDVTWETCTLRAWLNDDFYDTVFGTAEKARILTTAVINEDNIEYGTLGGNNTNDKIFLLSQSEAANADYGFNPNYDNPDVTREAAGTDYAKSSGLYVSDFSGYIGNSIWWQRSPGYYQHYAGNIDTDGFGGRSDTAVSTYIGVRPVLRVNANP